MSFSFTRRIISHLPRVFRRHTCSAIDTSITARTVAASATTSSDSSTSSAEIKGPRLTVGTGKNTQVFDRRLKRLQRDKSAENFDAFDYLRNEVAYRLADRIYDVKKFSDLAVDFGCGNGLVAPHIFKENIGAFVQLDVSEKMIQKSKKSAEIPTISLVADEEVAPAMFKNESIDLALSCLSMHWINDLPGFFKRVYSALKPDGAFIGAMFGCNTLYELRCSLQLAEMERMGGVSSHISPFAETTDIGSLMNRAGFKMLTLDVDDICVKYSSIYKLMYDLQGMAENSCSLHRSKHLNRDVLDAASAIYKAMYSEDEFVRATFQVIYVIGWRPGPGTPQPAKRGSAQVSFKDIGGVAGSSSETNN
uniref:Arginine-hydroxylase NDUFAF5, mitochondrial n=1 Tax=Romanomermis culicivorax TaxID=13658 RepID=A0A915HNS2_ROMCU